MNKDKIHVLKVYPIEFLNDIKRGLKTFDVRLNDRGFQVGDFLFMIAWDGEQYDYFNYALLKVTYILKDYAPAIGDGYVVMSIVYHPEYFVSNLVRQVIDNPGVKVLEDSFSKNHKNLVARGVGSV